MDEIKYSQDLLTKWQEADKENRGFILITSERTAKGNDSDSYTENCSIVGRHKILTAGVAGIIEDSKSTLLKIINGAQAHLMLLDLARKLNL